VLVQLAISHRDTLNIYSGGLPPSPLRFGVNMYKDIERLLRNIKVEDDQIILDKPLEDTIQGQRVYVHQVNYYYKWHRFSYWFGIFLNGYASVSQVFTLPDNVDDLTTFRDNIRLALKNTRWDRYIFKALIKLCKLSVKFKDDSGLKKCNVRFMKKKFDIDDWIYLFLAVYVYNILGVKKNLRAVLKLVSKVQSI
jgi:hypothetical protein